MGRPVRPKRFGCVQLEWKEKAISLFRFLFDFFCFFFSPPASSSLARCWAGPSFLLCGCFSALLLPRLITAEVININRGRRPPGLRAVGWASQQKSAQCHGMLRLDCFAFFPTTSALRSSLLSYIVLYYSQTDIGGREFLSVYCRVPPRSGKTYSTCLPGIDSLWVAAFLRTGPRHSRSYLRASSTSSQKSLQPPYLAAAAPGSFLDGGKISDSERT